MKITNWKYTKMLYTAVTWYNELSLEFRAHINWKWNAKRYTITKLYREGLLCNSQQIAVCQAMLNEWSKASKNECCVCSPTNLYKQLNKCCVIKNDGCMWGYAQWMQQGDIFKTIYNHNSIRCSLFPNRTITIQTPNTSQNVVWITNRKWWRWWVAIGLITRKTVIGNTITRFRDNSTLAFIQKLTAKIITELKQCTQINHVR